MATRITISALLLLLLVTVLNANAAVAQEGELKIEHKRHFQSSLDEVKNDDKIEVKVEVEGQMYAFDHSPTLVILLSKRRPLKKNSCNILAYVKAEEWPLITDKTCVACL